MPFILEKTNKNYSVSRVHGVLKIQTDHGQLVAVVNSFATLDAYREGLINWQDSYPIPTSSAGDPQAWLISPDGPFSGADILPEDGEEINQRRAVKIAELKARRNQLEKTSFEYLGYQFDSDQDSYNRMIGATESARANPDFEIDWTTADNSIVHLSNMDILGMIPALADHSIALHSKYNALKKQVMDAESSIDVASIYWL